MALKIERMIKLEKKDDIKVEGMTVGKVLFTEEQIIQRATELGRQITEDNAGKQLIVLGMIKGAVLWMSELVKHIDLDVKFDFIAASSYGSSTTSSGVVKVKKDVEMDLYKKDVLIVEDIVDTGTTLAFMQKYLA